MSRDLRWCESRDMMSQNRRRIRAAIVLSRDSHLKSRDIN